MKRLLLAAAFVASLFAAPALAQEAVCRNAPQMVEELYQQGHIPGTLDPEQIAHVINTLILIQEPAVRPTKAYTILNNSMPIVLVLLADDNDCIIDGWQVGLETFMAIISGNYRGA